MSSFSYIASSAIVNHTCFTWKKCNEEAVYCRRSLSDSGDIHMHSQQISPRSMEMLFINSFGAFLRFLFRWFDCPSTVLTWRAVNFATATGFQSTSSRRLTRCWPCVVQTFRQTTLPPAPRWLSISKPMAAILDPGSRSIGRPKTILQFLGRIQRAVLVMARYHLPESKTERITRTI